MNKIFHKIAARILRVIDPFLFGKIQEVSFRHNKNIRVLSVFPPEVVKVPSVFDLDGKEFFPGYSVDVPQAFILKIDNGILIVGREEVYTHELSVIKEMTTQKNNPSNGRSQRIIKSPISINGSILSLSLSGLEDN